MARLAGLQTAALAILNVHLMTLAHTDQICLQQLCSTTFAKYNKVKSKCHAPCVRASDEGTAAGCALYWPLRASTVCLELYEESSRHRSKSRR